jgi:hypothetical protein
MRIEEKVIRMMTEEGVLAVAVARRNVKYALPRDSEGLAKHHLQVAEEFLLSKKNEQFAPCFILFTEEQELVIDGRQFMQDGAARDVLVVLAKKVAKKIGAIASVFMSEVWLALATREETEQFLKDGKEMTRPSLRPDKIECMMAVGEYAGMKTHVATSSMVRDSAGAVISFKPVLLPGTTFDGRFSGILEPGPITN